MGGTSAIGNHARGHAVRTEMTARVAPGRKMTLSYVVNRALSACVRV